MKQEQALTKSELLDAIRASRIAFDAIIASLDEATLTRDGIEPAKSVKDLIAHITAWERRILAGIERGQRGQEPEWPEPGATMADMDRLNDRDFAANRNRSSAEVLAEARDSFARVLRTLEAMPDRDLTDPQRWPWTNGHKLLEFVRANTDEHYDEHREPIEAWLASGAST